VYTAARAKVPAVYTPHGFVYRFQLARPRRGRRARRRLGLTVERRLGRLTAGLVAVSREERRAAERDGVIAPGRVSVIHPGAEPDPTVAPDPALTRFRGDGPLLGFVAGLRDQKGLPTLLDALELLAERGAPVRFAIVGNGPLGEEVEARAHSGPLAATTLYTGFGGRVEPYLKALDVFVLPSYWEGLPIAIIEAMRLGLPVVGTAGPGTPQAGVECETGYLVPPRDPGALAEALARIAADPEGRRRMGAAGRELGDARFSLDRMIAETVELYRRLGVGLVS
jgi:glycosyltransferase involved in cell wall biosynthesis